MTKTGVTLLVFVFHSSFRLVNAIECQPTDMAQLQLESYFNWWYRLKNIFTKSNPLCSLDDEKRKKLCAQVAKACYSVLDKFKIENVLEVVDTPTECTKRTFTTPLLKDEQTVWSRKKRMFACKQFTVTGIRPIAEFYLSAAGIKNAVTVFHKPHEGSSIIQLIRMVTGLSYQEESEPLKEPQGQTDAKEKQQREQAKATGKLPQGQPQDKEKLPQGQSEDKEKLPQGQTQGTSSQKDRQ